MTLKIEITTMSSYKKELTCPTVQRLTEYLIILEQFMESGKETISSSELASIYSNTASQVRQDIFRLPNTGRVGHGYNVRELSQAIRSVLAMDNVTNVAMIGCGNLGSALAGHIPFENYSLKLVGAFDKDSSLWGSKIGGAEIMDIALMSDFIRENNVQVICLCVPAAVAQSVVDVVVKAGVTGILNYSRTRLKIPKDVYVQHKQIICSFMQVAYAGKQATD